MQKMGVQYKACGLTNEIDWLVYSRAGVSFGINCGGQEVITGPFSEFCQLKNPKNVRYLIYSTCNVGAHSITFLK